jgi:hypothetical protein
MRRIILFVIFCGLALHGFSIVPGYYGARSLSLGYASTAFSYDINSIFNNPAIIAGIRFSISGYQYQNSYMDYKGFGDGLAEVLSYDLAHFEDLNINDKSAAFSQLEELFHGKHGMYGFSGSVPGFVNRGYGLAIALVNTAIINPIDPSAGDMGNIFDKAAEDVTNQDIASLQMNFLGLKYKQISLSYGMPVGRGMNIGVTVHYLNGKINDFNRSLLDGAFDADHGVKEYLETSWRDPQEKFSRIVADVGATAQFGRFFSAGIVMRNFGGAKIKTGVRELALPKRIVAGLAFRPNPTWGFYLDMDVKKSELLYNGQETQPISFGIEKSFFKSAFFVRAGMLNDITEKHFFGKKANVLYGLGMGFNSKKVVVDVALGFDNNGTVKSLAISGFFLVR